MVLDPCKDPSPIVPDARGLAVHHALGAHHLSAEGLSDRLVTEADAEDRDASGEAPDQLDRDAGVLRRAWAGRDDDRARRERLDLGHADLVVANHLDVFAELGEVLHQIEGEGIVVVDHQHHRVPMRLILLLSESPFRPGTAVGDLGGWRTPTPEELRKHDRRLHAFDCTYEVAPRKLFGSPAARSAARKSARALCCVSCHSDCGSESATMPAAACT